MVNRRGFGLLSILFLTGCSAPESGQGANVETVTVEERPANDDIPDIRMTNDSETASRLSISLKNSSGSKIFDKSYRIETNSSLTISLDLPEGEYTVSVSADGRQNEMPWVIESDKDDLLRITLTESEIAIGYGRQDY